MVILASTAGVRGDVLIDVQAGVSSSYDYPLHPSGEKAVRSDDGNLAGSFQVSRPVALRWSLLAGGMYWSDKGEVSLGKVPEAPDREVSSQFIPVYGGLGFRVGPLEQGVALHLELSGGLVIVRSTVRDMPPAIFGPLSPARSAVESALAGRIAASLSVPLSSWVGLAFRGAYLHSGTFTNEKALIVSQGFGGLRQFIVSAGVEIRVLD
jgi:hypothetical protein